VRHSANRPLCRVSDEMHSAKHVTLGKERVSGSDYCSVPARRLQVVSSMGPVFVDY
jgi:hypothetical protein